MLQPHELEQIDQAARDLLEDPGVLIEDEDLVRRILAAGGRAGSRSGVVRVPSRMVTEELRKAPSRFVLADRAGRLSEVGPGCPSIFWSGAALFMLRGDEARKIGRADLADFCRVIERCDQVGGVVGTSVEEVRPVHRDFEGLAIMAAATRKHLRALAFTPRGVEAVVRMGEVLAGGRPLSQNPVVSIGFTAHGPLRWTNLALSVFRASAGHGVPCTVNGEPMAGASAPVTLAGTMAVGTAEILSGIVVNQLLEPGRPCFFNLGFAHVMDMRSGFAVTGGPENVLLAVAGSELASYYGLPSASWMCTDSLRSDAQNALEKTLAAVTHLQAGVSVIWGVGQVESEKTLSLVQAVIDDEIIGMARSCSRPPRVDRESLAVEVTRRVGVCGSFLGDEHTLEHFRDECYEPRLLVREQRAASKQADTLERRAEGRVRAILASPSEPILGEAERRELDRIAAAYHASIA